MEFFHLWPIFSQAPKKSSGNSHPRPKPAQVPLPGNLVFLWPGGWWETTRGREKTRIFFQRDTFLIFSAGGGKQNRSKGFLGVKMMEPIFVVGRDFGQVVFVFRVWKGCSRDVAGSFATFFFDHLIHQHPEDN